jgi:hypothetical protein
MKTKNISKAVLVLLLAVVFNNEIAAQNAKASKKITQDISYYRASEVTPRLVEVVYGKPQKNRKKIFGKSVAYDKVWITGADKITKVKFYQDVLFGNVKVSAGTYALLTIPGEKEWKIILSDNLDINDVSQYFPVFDVARITIPSNKAKKIKKFSIGFKEKKDIVQMVLGWGSTRVEIPITIKSKELYAKL